MAEIPINPYTKTPAQGPGLVDRYYREQGIRPPYQVLKDSQEFVDTLEAVPPQATQIFCDYVENQLNNYYESLQSDPEGQKRLQQILGGDREIQDAAIRYGNLKKNLHVLVQLVQGNKLQDAATLKKVREPLMAEMKKNGIPLGPNATDDELRDKVQQLGLKIQQDCGKSAARFYNRLAWDLWTSPKSNGMDKLVARDYLDAAWYAAAIKSPLGGTIDKPGIYNQLLREKIGQGLSSLGLKPFLSHKAFFSKDTTRKEALDFLERMPEAYGKLVDRVEGKAGEKPGDDKLLFPEMKGFSRKAFTHDSVEKAVEAYTAQTPSASNTPLLQDAFRTFSSYLQLARQNPELGAKLNYITSSWENHPDLDKRWENFNAIRQKAFDQEGNVIHKTAARKAQKALQLYYLKLAQILRDDKRSTPEERAISADYINAVARAHKDWLAPTQASSPKTGGAKTGGKTA